MGDIRSFTFEEEPADAYREWHRVLKPGGVLLNFDAEYAKGFHQYKASCFLRSILIIQIIPERRIIRHADKHATISDFLIMRKTCIGAGDIPQQSIKPPVEDKQVGHISTQHSHF